MMKTLLVVVLLVGEACAQPEKPDTWQEFKQKYGKVYKDPTEENHRMKVFAANQVRIAQHMREYAAGKRTSTVALNKFSDLTQEEINSRYKGIRWDEDTAPPESYETSASQGAPQESRRMSRRSASDTDMPQESRRMSRRSASDTDMPQESRRMSRRSASDTDMPQESRRMSRRSASDTDMPQESRRMSRRSAAEYEYEELPLRNASDYAYLPASFDYRQHGLVTSVKYQGDCGSCYVFPAVGAVEAAWAKAGHRLVDLSDLEPLDCAVNKRCFGGWHFAVLAYARERGLTHARSYLNFIERTAGSCPTLSPAETAYISAFAAVTPAGDELELQRVLVEHGPVAVGMYTRYFEFDYYKSGVFIEPECENYVADHVMLLIGYGTERLANGTEVDYWLLKNSWGANWGDSGYIKTFRKYGVNMCGVATWAFYPLTGETEYDFYGYGTTANVGDELWENLRTGNRPALDLIMGPILGRAN